jgi:hypothetical protein
MDKGQAERWNLLLSVKITYGSRIDGVRTPDRKFYEPLRIQPAGSAEKVRSEGMEKELAISTEAAVFASTCLLIRPSFCSWFYVVR